MKTLLIGLMSLSSVSAFAQNLTLTISTGNCSMQGKSATVTGIYSGHTKIFDSAAEASAANAICEKDLAELSCAANMRLQGLSDLLYRDGTNLQRKGNTIDTYEFGNTETNCFDGIVDTTYEDMTAAARGKEGRNNAIRANQMRATVIDKSQI
jgi:hypothetical protein